MTKILYYDCFCGISGDMNLAALLDLGVEEAYVQRELSKLNLDGEFELKIKKDIKKGITGTRVDVVLTHGEHDHSYGEGQSHHEGHHHHDGHSHGGHHHHHSHGEGHGTSHGHHHEHRNLGDIERFIQSSALAERVKKASMDIFMKVAEAEAKVHGKPVDQVHFHEVGAVDSIVDIVGAAICLDYLQVDKVMASPVQLGGGFVKCAHGTIPVPAPATVEILRNVPVKTGIVAFETTTPTGAAVLAAHVDEYTEKTNFVIDKIGYGIGHRELEIPNVLRVYLGHENPGEIREAQYILETNIDDMNPELYGYVEEKLFAQGAYDVFKSAIFMKKGRPGIKLSVLVDEAGEKAALDVIFRETTSLGVRKYPVEKIMLQREFATVETPYGKVMVKHGCYEGEKIKAKPEYEDCKRLAEENQVPIAQVYRAVWRAMEAAEHDKD